MVLILSIERSSWNNFIMLPLLPLLLFKMVATSASFTEVIISIFFALQVKQCNCPRQQIMSEGSSGETWQDQWMLNLQFSNNRMEKQICCVSLHNYSHMDYGELLV